MTHGVHTNNRIRGAPLRADGNHPDADKHHVLALNDGAELEHVVLHLIDARPLHHAGWRRVCKQPE